MLDAGVIENALAAGGFVTSTEALRARIQQFIAYFNEPWQSPSDGLRRKTPRDLRPK
jgi:hypothetical protein